MEKTDDLITLLKERLEFMFKKYQEDFNKYKEQEDSVNKLRSIFSGDIKECIKKLKNMHVEDICNYASFVNFNCTKDDLMKYKYVLTEPAFANSNRYNEARKKFELLAQQLRAAATKRIPRTEMKIAQQTCDVVAKFLEHIVDGRIVGGIEDIDSIITLFEYNPLNQFKNDEKKAIIKQLLVSDLTYLINYGEELEIEMMIQHEERINNSKEAIVIREDDSISEEKTSEEVIPEEHEAEVLDVDLPDKIDKGIEERNYRSITAKEKIDILNSIDIYCQKIVETYCPKSETHKNNFDELALRLKSEDISVGAVRSIVVSDKNIVYILARYLIILIQDLNEFLDAKYDVNDESMTELIDDQLNSIGATYSVIKEATERMKKEYYEEKVVDEVQEQVQEDGYNLIFVKNGLDSYFSKSLSELRDYENVINIEKILKDLEYGKFSNDRKVGEFKYKVKGSFAIFYKVKSGHVFVFNVMLARDISSKKTDTILGLITYEDAFKVVAEKGEEYQEMLEDSKKERELLKVMLGVAEGEYQP